MLVKLLLREWLNLLQKKNYYMQSLEKRLVKLEIHHYVFHMVEMVLFMMLKYSQEKIMMNYQQVFLK